MAFAEAWSQAEGRQRRPLSTRFNQKGPRRSAHAAPLSARRILPGDPQENRSIGAADLDDALAVHQDAETVLVVPGAAEFEAHIRASRFFDLMHVETVQTDEWAKAVDVAHRRHQPLVLDRVGVVGV